MDDRFLEITTKVARAREHLFELNTACREYWINCQPKIVIEGDAGNGNKLVKVVVENQVPHKTKVVLGEAIQQLRSSLDYIAAIAAERSAGPVNMKRLLFPYSSVDEADFLTNGIPRLKGLDNEFIEIIKACKSYKGGDDLLASIFVLSNVDKHAKLAAMSSLGQLTGLAHMQMYNISMKFDGRDQNLQDGIVFGEAGQAAYIVPRNENAAISLTGSIKLADAGDLSGEPIPEFIAQVIDHGEATLLRLIKELKATGKFG